MQNNKLDFFSFHKEIIRINRLIRAILRKRRVRFDSNSLTWAEQIRENLNLLVPHLKPYSIGLDIGCGKGHIAAILSQKGFNMTGTDIPVTIGEPMAIEDYHWQKPIWAVLAKKYGVTYKLGDGKKLNYKSRSFDFVVAYAVIEHITPPSDIPKFIKESYRALKPGGYFLLADSPQPNSYTERWSARLGLGSHPVTLKPSYIASELKNANFVILSQECYDLLPSQPPGRFGHIIVNILFPFLYIFERILRKTPLIKYAHHSRTLALKKK